MRIERLYSSAQYYFPINAITYGATKGQRKIVGRRAKITHRSCQNHKKKNPTNQT